MLALVSMYYFRSDSWGLGRGVLFFGEYDKRKIDYDAMGALWVNVGFSDFLLKAMDFWSVGATFGLLYFLVMFVLRMKRKVGLYLMLILESSISQDTNKMWMDEWRFYFWSSDSILNAYAVKHSCNMVLNGMGKLGRLDPLYRSAIQEESSQYKVFRRH